MDGNKVQNEPRGAPFPTSSLGLFPGGCSSQLERDHLSLSPAPEWAGEERGSRWGLGRTGTAPWGDSPQDHPVANLEMVTGRLWLIFKQLFPKYSAERRKPLSHGG